MIANHEAGGPHDVDQPTTTAAAAAAATVSGDGQLIQNGGGDGVATATTGVRQRSVDVPTE